MPIKVNQIIRSKRKTLALIVKSDGSLIVRAPYQTPAKSIKAFVEHNVRWIKKKQNEVLADLPPAPKQYIAGETFLYLGKIYPLEIINKQKMHLILEQSFRLARSAQGEGASAFECWYREQAKKIFCERVNLYARQYGFQHKGIKITSARTRWGSCSPNGALNFSWRLILAPMDVVDYVVVHELVHTVFHNHSKRFWQKVEQIMPDYQERKKWLRDNGQRLML